MVADLNDLVRLQKSQIRPAGEMCARAFQDYPLHSYYLPDASRRKKVLPYIFEFMIRFGVAYGEVYATSSNLGGIAVWLPPDKDMTLWRAIRSGALSLYFKVGRKCISRLSYVNNFYSQVHKRHAPFRHWFLLLLGVDPMFQGKGYASVLLKAMLARIDKEQLPCYIETESEKNVPVYQHYGFKVVEETIIPGTGVCLRAMLRGSSG